MGKELEANPISQTVAANIVSERKLQGWSQAELAEKLGCSQQAVWYWETCRREMPNDMVMKVAGLLGKSWLWFYQDHTGIDVDTVEIPRSEWEQFRQLKALLGTLVANGAPATAAPRKRAKANTKPGYNIDPRIAQTLTQALSQRAPSGATAGMDAFLLNQGLSPTG